MEEREPLQDLVFTDAWVNVLLNLTIAEIARTRLVCSDWYKNGKEQIKLYKVGLDNKGWSHWHGDANPVYGWGMKISVDSRGIVRGINKNTGEHENVAQEKVYSGLLEKTVFTISVFFPKTEQLNEYTGSIVCEEGKVPVFRGTFRLIHSCGHRKIGSTGTIEGEVQEA